MSLKEHTWDPKSLGGQGMSGPRQRIGSVPKFCWIVVAITVTLLYSQQQILFAFRDRNPRAQEKAVRILPLLVQSHVQNRRSQARYLTYARFPGRLNNQIHQLVTMLQHSFLLQRVLILPPETSVPEFTGMFRPELDMWNLSLVHERFVFELFENSQHGHLEHTVNCSISQRQFERLLEADYKFADCHVLHVRSGSGLISCNGLHGFCGNETEKRIAYSIYPLLFHMSNSFRSHILQGDFAVAIHSRTFGGVADGGQNPEICPNLTNRALKSYVKSPSPILQRMHGGQCALWEGNNLEMQLPPKLTPGKILLADDNNGNWSQLSAKWSVTRLQNFWKPESTKYFVKALARHPEELMIQTTGGKHAFVPQNIHVERVAHSIWDMLALASPEYFVGNIFSTFSLTICMLRGEARKQKSNICALKMHTRTRWAELKKGQH
mmetsp:Transcript_34200/g.84087  ORF Transcript_34200/g.84087 Transcript_34200/m.84087 type:complete len:437 (+) Transcript_34200:339-1649(+)